MSASLDSVVIAGVGQAPVAEHWDKSLRELAWMAIEAALIDAGWLQPQALFVGNMLAPILSRQTHLGALLVDFCGLNGIEAATIEAGGASGGAALRQGYLAIASGQADVVLVVGVEKFTEQGEAALSAALSTNTDSDYEAVHGLTPNAQAALLMQRYLYEYQPPRESFGGFALIAHANGENNSNAMFRKAISPEAYAKAGVVTEPLNLFDIAPLGDGAAALLLTRADLLPPGFPHPLVRIAGSSLVSDRLALHDRANPLELSAARRSVENACAQAGIAPGEANLFELYDATTLHAALSLEAAGFSRAGEGWKLAQDGSLALSGALPIATQGGLKARGNPGGATGVYQVVEATLQLRGQAGKNQVRHARWGLAQCLAGPAAAAATHVLERLG